MVYGPVATSPLLRQTVQPQNKLSSPLANGSISLRILSTDVGKVDRIAQPVPSEQSIQFPVCWDNLYSFYEETEGVTTCRQHYFSIIFTPEA